MMKTLLIFLFGLMVCQSARAIVPDTLLLFYKNDGKSVKTKDSADFFRFIMSPDTSIDKDLYRVYDFYMDGKPRMVAYSLSGTENLALDGSCINYFRNGKRKAFMTFEKGLPKGYMTNYYPNGETYAILKSDIYYSFYTGFRYTFGANNSSNIKIRLIELRDSTGKIIAANGKGHVILYDDEFKKVLEEGNVVNNLRDGVWKGELADTGRYEITYHRGNIKSGVSYLRSGKSYTFKEVRTVPVFSDGIENFRLFLKNNAQYLESARKRKISGSVYVKFFVEPNGTVSDATISGVGLTESLNEEAIRVIKLSPLWVPGTVYGIPTRMAVTFPVYFLPN